MSGFGGGGFGGADDDDLSDLLPSRPLTSSALFDSGVSAPTDDSSSAPGASSDPWASSNPFAEYGESSAFATSSSAALDSSAPAITQSDAGEGGFGGAVDSYDAYSAAPAAAASSAHDDGAYTASSDLYTVSAQSPPRPASMYDSSAPAAALDEGADPFAPSGGFDDLRRAFGTPSSAVPQQQGFQPEEDAYEQQQSPFGAAPAESLASPTTTLLRGQEEGEEGKVETFARASSSRRDIVASLLGDDELDGSNGHHHRRARSTDNDDDEFESLSASRRRPALSPSSRRVASSSSSQSREQQQSHQPHRVSSGTIMGKRSLQRGPLASLLGIEVPKQAEPKASSKPEDVLNVAAQTRLPPSRPDTPSAPVPAPATSALSREPSDAATPESGTGATYSGLVSPLEKPESKGETSPAEREASKDDEVAGAVAALKIDTQVAEDDKPATEGEHVDTPTRRDSETETETLTTQRSRDTLEHTSPSASMMYEPASSASETMSISASMQSTDATGADADSLRATYSASAREGDSSTFNFSPSVRPESLNSASNGSPPLPAIPASLPASPESSAPPPAAPPLVVSEPIGPAFTISVGDPQKVGSSLNVASQHILYTVRTRTTSPHFRRSDFSVLRRFSHFLWLFDALTLNNPGVIVPGMPEKSAMGRFDAEFVEQRRVALETALNKIVAHPMLVGDPDLRLFLESDTFNIDIKQRKIDTAAESKGGGFLSSWTSSVSTPRFVEFDDFFDNRKVILDGFEAQLRSLIGTLSVATKLRVHVHSSLGELADAFAALATCDISGPLKAAFERAAAVERRTRELAEQQLRSEEQVGGLTSTAEAYLRLCSSVRHAFASRVQSYHTWQASESTLRKARVSHDKVKHSGRSEMLGMSLAEVADAERRALNAKQEFDDVSKLLKAEMARYDKEKVEDFKKAIEGYVDGMLTRQREIVAIWTSYQQHLLKAAEVNTQLMTAAQEESRRQQQQLQQQQQQQQASTV